LNPLRPVAPDEPAPAPTSPPSPHAVPSTATDPGFTLTGTPTLTPIPSRDARDEAAPHRGRPAARPTSATDMVVNATGAIVLLATLWVCRGAGDVGDKVLLLLGAPALVIGALDLGVLRVHRRASTGLDWSGPRAFDLTRVLTKLLGLAISVAALAVGYWAFPEYHGSFYDPFYRLLSRLWLPVTIAAPLYVAWVDSRMSQPRDAYWQLGRCLLGRFSDARPAEVASHARAWAVKGFFLPLMAVYLHQEVAGLLASPLRHLSWSDLGLYHLLYSLAFTIDLVFTTIGYLLAFRVSDSHVRSTEPTMSGWVAALLCYQPFYGLIGAQYLSYESGVGFADWLGRAPAVRGVWAVVIVALLLVYALTTIAFGWRFSNLTHRGIITGGPFRFTKHPAYLSKNLSWWLISVPFISQAGRAQALRHTALLLALNAIYFWRARTEERHLSADPTYVAYAEWINEHGLLRTLGRWLPLLRYHPPDRQRSSADQTSTLR
jgi:protein-S-isoprenylcysteine O-methyltransferase Ste14